MPRIPEQKACPHCGADLPTPTPRVCPECMGSLQQRHLKAGCLTSGPACIAGVIGLGWLALRYGLGLV